MLPLMLDDRFDTMPWDEIDAVVFDVGNVLLSFDPEAILADWTPDDPELRRKLRARMFHSPYWIAMDSGRLTNEEAVELMIGGDESIAPHARRVMANWISMKEVLQEGVDAMRTCKAHGKKIYILSNYGNESFEVIDQKYDFFRLADGKIISARVGLLKPDPEIYHCVERTFRINPDRTVFIDDSPINIEAALALGWQGICYSTPGQLARFIR